MAIPLNGVLHPWMGSAGVPLTPRSLSSNREAPKEPTQKYLLLAREGERCFLGYFIYAKHLYHPTRLRSHTLKLRTNAAVISSNHRAVVRKDRKRGSKLKSQDVLLSSDS